MGGIITHLTHQEEAIDCVIGMLCIVWEILVENNDFHGFKIEGTKTPQLKVPVGF